jgi:hypothetical protein
MYLLNLCQCQTFACTPTIKSVPRLYLLTVSYVTNSARSRGGSVVLGRREPAFMEHCPYISRALSASCWTAAWISLSVCSRGPHSLSPCSSSLLLSICCSSCLSWSVASSSSSSESVHSFGRRPLWPSIRLRSSYALCAMVMQVTNASRTK